LHFVAVYEQGVLAFVKFAGNSTLMVRSAERASRDDALHRSENHEARSVASPFETPLARLLRVRVEN
jgi:hypothetical protein